jgi:hypothetical protein
MAPPAQGDELNESNENNENNKYYANSAYEEGSPTLYVQVGHAFSTLKLIVEKREE